MNFNKTETDSQTQETTYGNQTGSGGRDKSGIWDYYIHITIYKTDKQQDLLFSMGMLFSIL